MEFKPIWKGADWELLVNDKDKFKIQGVMTGDNILIEADDKEEFHILLSRLDDELWAETAE